MTPEQYEHFIRLLRDQIMNLEFEIDLLRHPPPRQMPKRARDGKFLPRARK